MAKNIVVYIFAFVLLFAIALGCVAVFKIGKGISDSFDTLFVTDTQMESGTNTDTSTDTSADSEAIAPHSIKLGDNALDVVAVNNVSGKTARLGFRTFDLKENTKYRVSWTINPVFLTDTQCRFVATDNGYGVAFAPRYFDVSDGLASFSYIYFESEADICNFTAGYEFTSGSSGSNFVVFLMELDFVSVEDTIAAKAHIDTYVTSFEIVEVLE